MKALSRSGMSLVSVMMAVVLMGIVGVGIATLFNDSQKNQLALNQRAEFDRLVNYTKLVLGSRTDCGLDLPTLSAKNFSLTTLPHEIVIDKIGSKGEVSPAYPLKQLKLDPIVLKVTAQIETQPKVDAFLMLSATKNPTSPGGPILRDGGIPVILDLTEPSPGNYFVSGCTAVSAVGIGGIDDLSSEEKTCELLGRAYDEELGRCSDAPPSDPDAIEFLGGKEALSKGQQVMNCTATAGNGKPKTSSCEPNYSEHRINSSLGNPSDVPELMLNTKSVTRKTNIRGACIFDEKASQWYRGTWQIDGSKKAPKAPTEGRLLSQVEDSRREMCSNVQVANVAQASGGGAILKPSEMGSFSTDPVWWKTPDNMGEIEKVEICYTADNKGVPGSQQYCRQGMNTKPDGTFRSYPGGFCGLNPKTSSWARWTSDGWKPCKGGVSLKK
jgi:hypothetical protein